MSTASFVTFACLLLCWSVACLHHDEVFDEIHADAAWLRQLRRNLHQIPEIKYTEEKTSTYLRQQLDALGIPYKHPYAKHGIVATIGNGKGPCIALRTDMDALPIPEELEVPYKSLHPGFMHACGHDAHMTMLLGAAKYLKAHEAEVQGTVKLLFQPAEEGGAGAKLMVDEGAMEGVSAVFGIHVWPSAPSGTIQTRAGTLMAGTDKFYIRISGRGGHGGTPHVVKDSVVTGSAVVMNLQPLVSRETDPTQGGIVGVTLFNSGPGSPNVHPHWVELQGTVNSFSVSGLLHLKQRISQIVSATASMYGCNSSIAWNPIEYIPVVNSKEAVDVVKGIAQNMSAIKRFQELDRPTFMAEDVAFFNDVASGAFVFLGIGDAKLGTNQLLHTPRFQMDESMLPVGAALHANVAFKLLLHFGHRGMRQRQANDEL